MWRQTVAVQRFLFLARGIFGSERVVFFSPCPSFLFFSTLSLSRLLWPSNLLFNHGENDLFFIFLVPWLPKTQQIIFLGSSLFFLFFSYLQKKKTKQKKAEGFMLYVVLSNRSPRSYFGRWISTMMCAT